MDMGCPYEAGLEGEWVQGGKKKNKKHFVFLLFAPKGLPHRASLLHLAQGCHVGVHLSMLRLDLVLERNKQRQ